jgi:5'-nucleotidase (lipoprotein e(P4) family)
MKNSKSVLVLILLITACQTQKQSVSVSKQQESMVFGAKLYTAFYQQQAAEYKALCVQSYNLAKMMLDASLSSKSPMPPAIVTDIDETILDNSRYAVKRALENKEYTLESWQEWTSLAMADTLAGALAFFNYAKSKGVEVFYITNREEAERAGTQKNLEKFGFPYADSTHLILRQGTSSKELRRQAVAANHTILLYIGDNLGDLSARFDKKTSEERNRNVMELNREFGSRYIILPNPFYGDWEGSTFKYNYSLSPAQKDSVIRTVLKGY